VALVPTSRSAAAERRLGAAGAGHRPERVPAAPDGGRDSVLRELGTVP
jgi:hypothetical protein